MSKEQSKPKPVLSDHKRVGKRFIPPFMHQCGEIHELKWIDGPMPELLWLALLNHAHGFALGAELGLAVARAATSAVPRDVEGKKTWFAPTSSFWMLSEAHQQNAVAAIRKRGQMDEVQSALTPLIALYPRCPLRFLFDEEPPGPRPEYLPELKRALVPLFDQTTKEATLMQASALDIAFASDILRVAKSTSLANFPAVAGYPDTDEAVQIGASVRAAIRCCLNATCGHTSRWCAYFWNRGLEIDACQFEPGDPDA